VDFKKYRKTCYFLITKCKNTEKLVFFVVFEGPEPLSQASKYYIPFALPMDSINGFNQCAVD